MNRTAFLIYTDTYYPFSKFFKEGFRHVAIVIRTDSNYVLIDPRASTVGLELTGRVVPDTMERQLRDNSHAIQRVSTVKGKGFFPIGLFTCVSLFKKLLGIRAWWVLTPYQLYNYINKRGLNEYSKTNKK